MDETRTASTGHDVTQARPVVRALAPVVLAGRTTIAAARPLTRPRVVVGREPGSTGLVVDDAQVSRRHFVIEWSDDGYRVRDLGSHNGTFVDGRPAQQADLRPGAVVRAGHSLFVYCEVMFEPGLSTALPEPGRALARVHAERWADLAAPTDAPVLVLGPTGAGKERLVSRVHAASGRSGRLVAVNCATLGRELIGSELFGHKKGAFSGAESDREGLVAAADGGTLFLDEISELPLPQQATLLRVLQERRVRPVGSDSERAVDVRFVAATHEDLAERCDAGLFRKDLFARIAGITLRLPGLAERKEEVASLFLEILDLEGVTLSLEAAEALLAYDWPQNIREVEHAATRVRLLLGDQRTVGLAHLPDAIRDASRSRPAAPPPETLPGAPTRATLVDALRRHAGSVSKVAKEVGKHRMQVYRWLGAYGLDPKTFRGS
ncbi:MAG: sigma 54-interacting transcriptional regulator [Deltaproteobacteria bacterium]